MKVISCLATLAAAALSGNVQALGALAQVCVIDRDSGAILPAHYYQGEYWVAGRPGAHYAIEIRNGTGGRLLAVTSVDGVNVLSGESAGWGQSGYVFDPGERFQITGWRKSQEQVAAFTFTDLPNSYAARTGRPANVGVIGVAVFRELLAPPPTGASVSGSAPTPVMPEALSRAAPSQEMQGGISGGSPSAPAAKLGTGHGEREYSYVQYTDFQRRHTQPDEMIRIRYDSFDNLVAMGVIARAHPAPLPVPEPFPGTPQRQFVPDPPG
jgi:hypothetical protein